MKRKLLILLLSMFALILVGCGPQETATQESSVEVTDEVAADTETDTDTDTDDDATTVTDQATTKVDGEYDLVIWEDQNKAIGIEAAVALFEEEHDVSIQVIESAYAQQLENLRLDGPAGTGPDVFTMPGDQIGTAVTEGLLMELEVSKEEQAVFTESAMSSQIVDGSVYGLPKSVETQILYYNRDLISDEDLPETMEEWYELSQANTNEQFAFLALWDQLYYAMGVMGGYGGYIFAEDADGNYQPEDIGLATDGTIEGATYIQKFYTEGIFPSGLLGEQGINVLDSLFTEGKVSAVISGPWNLEPYAAAGIDYGVAELPLLPNGEHMQSFIGVKSYNVSSYSKNKELAEAFVKFITNEENSLARYEATREVPAIIALAENPAVTEDAASAAVAAQSQYAKLTPGIMAMNSVWEPMDSALQTIANGTGEPEKALQDAVQLIKDTIDALQ